MAEITGTTLTAPVKGGDKFRVTWQFALSSVLPSWAYYDATDIARLMREWLPQNGFIPVSAPSAVSGDEVIVYDVRLAQEWNGRNVAAVLNELEQTPWFWSLNVQRLTRVDGVVSSVDLQADQEQALQDAKATAATNVVFQSAENFLQSAKGALGAAAQVVALLAIAAIVGGAVYLYRESHK